MATDLQKQWEQRIERARKARDEWAEQFKVGLGRAYFEGKDNPGYPADEWISINKIYAHLMAQLPTLYSVDPYFYIRVKKSFQVDPQQPVESSEGILAMERKGKVRQSYLNYLKGELELKKKARLAIMDAHFAYGVVKARRTSEMEEHPNAGEPIVDDDNKPVLDPETLAPQVYPDELPTNERYELNRIHPDDFLWDQDSGPLEDDWNWVAQRTTMSKAKALKDRRFKKAEIEKIKGTDVKDSENEKKGFFSRITSGPSDEKDKIITFWEIYDLDEKKFLIIGIGADKPLKKPQPTPPGIEGHPFAILRFTLRDKGPYPIPPVFPALDPQKEFSLTRSRLLTHRKRFARKYEVDVNKLEDPEQEMSKLESGEDGTLIRVMAAGAINPIKDAPLDQQNLLETQALDRDITEAFGSPGAAVGIANADSATEAGILDKRLEIREGDRLSEVVDFVTTIARKLDQLVQFHISGDEAVKITGPQGEVWRHISEKDYEAIEGEFEYSVNVGATQQRLPEIERSQWIAFLSQVVVPLPHILTKPAVMRRIAEMFHIEDEAALEEFRELGEAILSGQVPAPGNTGGGPPGGSPESGVLGQALGSLGGNVNGGGAGNA